MSGTSDTVWSHCNECGRETKHEVLKVARTSRTYETSHPDYTVDVSTTWKMLRCAGCEEVMLHRTQWCSEDDPYDGPSPGTYFPPRVSRRKPAWVERLEIPDEYNGLLNEIYVALHGNSRRLAMMGARALIDVVIQRSVGDQGNFMNGLQALVDKQLISERHREILDAAIGMGSASAHRGHLPKAHEVEDVIDIVENLIHNELLVVQASALKTSTPPRVRSQKHSDTKENNASD